MDERIEKEHGQQREDAYRFAEIEPRWQQAWEERGTFHAPDDDPREKLYVLQMFPYPSGTLHAGHIRNYVIGDAVARYWRMRGLNVMHPMGFDSFGLPAEQAAIDRGIQPSAWIEQCIAEARRQFQRYGFSFDWQRELNTSDPAYYRWTQWLFIEFYRRGLIYRKATEVNWCEEHGVLANDEVKDGTCWRCERTVSKRKLEQWNMRTTDYAQRLLDGLDKLPGWNDSVRTMQRNWIGRSEGTTVRFAVPAVSAELEVYTTRVDTIFGATFMAIAPDHPLAAVIAEHSGTAAGLAEFREQTAREAAEYGPGEEKPKRGLALGADCVNPFNNEAIPIWATNYVVSEFGTGAVMAVPAHDARDHAFATQYGLPIREVVVASPARSDARPPDALGGRPSVAAPYSEPGLLIDSGEFAGLDSAAAKEAMGRWLSERSLGGPSVQYKLRDWNMGRQRFWGAPIPMVNCGACGWLPVADSDLPVKLPERADYSDLTLSPLANDEEWQQTSCPECGGPARRDTDTMTTFMDSAWYFLRFADPHNDEAIFARDKVEAWLPVDYYVGGKEHAVGHLLYSRFITEALKDFGYLSLTKRDHQAVLPPISDEPFLRLFNQGIVYKDGAKMSKSKGNVVSSDELAERYGADTARLFALFGGPADMDLEWSTSGVEGCHRFLRRVWRLATAVHGAATGDDSACRENCLRVLQSRHRTVAGVSEDLIHWRFNTAIAKLMEFLNALEDEWKQVHSVDEGGAFSNALLTMAQLLSPFAPHIAEELWHMFGESGLAAESHWPQFDPAMLRDETVEIAVQVNGKLRGRVNIASDALLDDVLRLAAAEENVSKWLEGKEIVKQIYVPGRMVTFVVK